MRTSKYNQLLDLYNAKSTISGIRSHSHVQYSIYSILTYGWARTGQSYYNRGGWAKKEIWTQAVSDYLTKCKIAHICYNDAPRGGANGEQIKITDKAFLKSMKIRKDEVELKAKNFRV